MKKLYYKVDDVAKVGQPLVDLEVADDVAVEESSSKAETETHSRPKTEVLSARTSAADSSVHHEDGGHASPGRCWPLQQCEELLWRTRLI